MGNFEPRYPESLASFADGIRSDVMDIIETGANALNKSFSLIFPFVAGYENMDAMEDDSIHDIEVKSTPHKSSKSSNKMKQSQDALRMRCSSMWNEKRSNENILQSSSQSRAQKGGKVLLEKLARNPKIQSFQCGNENDLLILGNLRMILARKNLDANNSASILWSQTFRDIASCAINCSLGATTSTNATNISSDGACKLDITNRDNEVFTIGLQDTNMCISVMMIIQQRCSHGASAPAVPANTTASAPLSPLSIGSSPAVVRGRQSARGRVQGGKKKKLTDCQQDKENSTGGSGVKSCRSPTSSRPLKNLENTNNADENCDESPLKKVRLSPRQSDAADKTSETKGVVEGLDMSPSSIFSTLCQSYSGETNKLSAPRVLADQSIVSTSVLLKSYQQLLDSGSTIESVVEKMAADGIDERTVSMFQKKHFLQKQEKEPSNQKEGESKLDRFRKMLKNGVPPPAVQQKMKMEGFSQAEQESVMADAKVGPSLPTPSPVEAVTSKDCCPAHLKKYQVMLKSGVPKPAVQQKMTLEGIAQSEKDLVLGEKSSGTSISPALSKYQVMLKSGVPMAAVIHKMTMEGVSEVDQEKVVGKRDNQIHTSAGPDKTPTVSRSKFVGLHWEPIPAGDNTSLKNSIWGEIGGNGDSCSTELQQDEITSLSTLFSKKETPAKSTGKECNNTVSAGETLQSNQTTLRKKKTMPTTIDMSRSTNISIGLSSFKQKKMGIDEIIVAIGNLDVNILHQEDLLRLKEILPTDNEVKALKAGIREDDMHDTEKWLHKLASVPGAIQKVKSMLFMVSAENAAMETKKSLQMISGCIDAVMNSSGLRELMKCVLAIGNAMNKGTWKGGARGFRLASLIRLQQTKSTDGKSTVMDYLLQVLQSRHDNGGDEKAFQALNLDEELGCVHRVKNLSFSDLKREVQALTISLSNLSKDFSGYSSLGESHKERIGNFINATEKSLSELKVILNSTQEKCSEIVVFFGEEADMPINQIMSLLAEFLTAFCNSKTRHLKKIAMEKRKLK